jgi:DeoR/GlpR family transcriptional regulator of sugar metabolism
MNDMTIKKRIDLILEILSLNRKIKVKLLAEWLDVSDVTLRKDLDNLEKQGMIRRTHGYVCLGSTEDTSARMALSHSIKRRIAKEAVLAVEEGETIMLDSGSCCALFAEELVQAKKNITIITNSVFISNHVYKLSANKLILLGGHLQPESQVMVGPVTKKCAQEFYSDKYFMGADGFIPGHGFTGKDLFRVETAVELSKRAKEIYVLTEAEKFKRRGAHSLMHMDKITGVYTDENIPKDAEEALRKHNVSVHKVPAKEERVKWNKFPGQPPILYTEKD